MTKEQAIQGLKFLAKTCVSDEDTAIFNMAMQAIEHVDDLDTLNKGLIKEIDYYRGLYESLRKEYNSLQMEYENLKQLQEE